MKSIVQPPTLASALSVVACSKQQPATPTKRGSRGAHPLLLPHVLWGLFACAAGAARAESTYLDLIGGFGGRPFDGGCPPDQNLGGFELRTGDYVDAIRPVCVISFGPSKFSVAPVQPPFFGGPGGKNSSLVCPPNMPIVIGIDVGAKGKDFVTVNNIHLFCGQAIGAQTPSARPSEVYDNRTPSQGARFTYFGVKSQRCPAGQVAIGMHGRSGSWLDAMGLICDAPRIMSASQGGSVPRLLGERGIGQGSGDPPPVHKLGRAETAFGTGDPPRPICDVAREARTRNSPAAPGLESQCRAELAARGEAIANQDPLSAELRRRARNDLSRRGFDIGLAAAEGDTAPGPGKQAIHNALSGVEQAAFDAAVSFSLQRNRNAALAATGAAIAQADPAVAQARAADKDVFFWLGFDIATGIFGDPAQGALGNTATGPGSLGIRDALDAAAQRGFNASVDFHLRRIAAKKD